MPDISIPPWLTQPLNEAEMYQRGMSLGAQMGAQRAQQRMAELSAQRQAQEMAMQQAQFETTQSLRERAFEQEAQEAARRTMAQMRYKSLVESGVDPAKAMMQTPELFGNSLAGVAAMMRDEERAKAASAFTPRIVSTGEDRFFESSPNKWDYIRPPTTERDSESERILKNLQDSKMALENATRTFAALSENDPGKAAAEAAVTSAREQFSYWDSRAKGPVTSITATSPTGETFSVNTGNAGAFSGSGVTGDIQKGLQTRGIATMVAKKLAPIETSMEIVTWLEPRLNRKTSGPIGSTVAAAGNILGAVIPPLTPDRANEVAQKVTILRNKIATEIPEGGHETAAKRAEILSALPETGIFTNPGKAQTALKTTREYLMSQARNYAAEIGRAPLVSMTPDEIRKDFAAQKEELKRKRNAGLISAQQALEIANQLKSEYDSALKRYWNE